MKKFLIIQIRPEDEAADNELAAFMSFGNLDAPSVHRIQADRESIPELNLENYAGVIMGGGPANITDKQKSEDTMRMEQEIFALLDQVVEKDIPYLGACYGFGALVAHQKALMSKDYYSEDVGATDVELTKAGETDPLTTGLPKSFKVFGGHKEACDSLPMNATLLVASKTCPVQMFKLKQNIYATQFHPELDTEGIIVRINVYRYAGYFPPAAADDLIAAVRGEDVTVPVEILKRFVKRYR